MQKYFWCTVLQVLLLNEAPGNPSVGEDAAVVGRGAERALSSLPAAVMVCAEPVPLAWPRNQRLLYLRRLLHPSPV